MECGKSQPFQIQTLETQVLRLWEEIARAKVSNINNNHINNLLLKVDELAILIMELNDVGQKSAISPCQPIVIIERKAPVYQRPEVINYSPLPTQIPSTRDDYPDFVAIVAAIILIIITYKIFRFVLAFILEIFRSHC